MVCRDEVRPRSRLDRARPGSDSATDRKRGRVNSDQRRPGAARARARHRERSFRGPQTPGIAVCGQPPLPGSGFWVSHSLSRSACDAGEPRATSSKSPRPRLIASGTSPQTWPRAWQSGACRTSRMSAHVDAPVVTGFLTPVVILPIDRFPALTDRQQQMALCHELTHIKRADLRLGCLPALAERMFFFHPLAHLAAREYALWREAACDAAVLKTLDVSPAEYGQFLIGLGVAGRRTGLVAAGTSWSFANLKRRLVMLRHPSTTSTTSQVAAAGAFAVAIAAMVPVQLTARPAPTVHPPITTTRAPAVLVPSEPTPSEAMTLGTVAGDRGLSQDASPQPARTKKQELTYVLFLDDTHTTTSASPGDVERARTFKRPGEPLLWVRDRGAEYVVRDPAVLGRDRGVVEVGQSIGDQQGQLGLEQEQARECWPKELRTPRWMPLSLARPDDQGESRRLTCGTIASGASGTGKGGAATDREKSAKSSSGGPGAAHARAVEARAGSASVRRRNSRPERSTSRTSSWPATGDVLQTHMHEADVRMRLEVVKSTSRGCAH